LHPTNADLWLLAIRFEADGTAAPTSAEDEDDASKSGGIGGGNIDAARKLVLRALRFMQSESSRLDAVEIWKEWVRLEISLVERMRKRWQILGIADALSGKSNIELEVVDEALSVQDQSAALEVRLLSPRL